MKVHLILTILLYFVLAENLHCQKWMGRVEYLKSNSGEIMDSFRIYEWPLTVPDYLRKELDFKLISTSRLHNNRIDLKFYDGKYSPSGLSLAEQSFWRGHFAVYKHNTARLQEATLYTAGVGLGYVQFPVNGDGHYLTLVIWGGDKAIETRNNKGRMIYCRVEDGRVHLYDVTKCE